MQGGNWGNYYYQHRGLPPETMCYHLAQNNFILTINNWWDHIIGLYFLFQIWSIISVYSMVDMHEEIRPGNMFISISSFVCFFPETQWQKLSKVRKEKYNNFFLYTLILKILFHCHSSAESNWLWAAFNLKAYPRSPHGHRMCLVQLVSKGIVLKLSHL